jgi:hypothetical protein
MAAFWVIWYRARNNILAFNTLCCGIGWGVGWHLIWFRDHPAVASAAWRGLCDMAWDLWHVAASR